MKKRAIRVVYVCLLPAAASYMHVFHDANEFSIRWTIYGAIWLAGFLTVATFTVNAALALISMASRKRTSNVDTNVERDEP